MFISDRINLEFSADARGNQKDLIVIADALWLHNAEVIYHISEQKGRWFLSMIYISTELPKRLICRPIDNYESLTKAETYAKIFQRGIRRDARGTLKCTYEFYDICPN